MDVGVPFRISIHTLLPPRRWMMVARSVRRTCMMDCLVQTLAGLSAQACVHACSVTVRKLLTRIFTHMS
jgi:hypothetical protein